MSNSPEKSGKHWIDHANLYNALAGGLLALVVAVATHSVNKEAAEDRKLQWRPVLSLDVRASASGDRDTLGMFLQNVGKGPAQLELACQVGAFEPAAIPGLRQSVGRIRSGALVGAGEAIALNTYTPEPGKAWTADLERQLVGMFEQSQHWSVTLFYRSLYSADGCFVVHRALVNGEWVDSRQEQACGDYRCQATEQPIK